MRRALLVIERGGDEPEAVELAESAGYSVVELVPVRRIGEGRSGVSAGKAREIVERARAVGADAIVLYGRVSSSQAFNLMRDSGLRVVDRDQLILEIFALRAGTPEAKLQVKLAELTYELPRLRELIRRVRMGEQPGLYGYGEYEVERYYDHVRRMQMRIREELGRYSRHREVQRSGRSRWGFPLISLAGYTGAGKTTLFNALTRESMPVTGRAFTTLTTTTRVAWLGGDGRALLTDTVGFLSGLPHYMIEAFRSTLEELRYADLVLLVIDASEDPEVAGRKYETSVEILQELSVEQARVLHVLNKVDLVGEEGAAALAGALGIREYVAVSAARRTGLDALREEIRRALGTLGALAEARACRGAGGV
ncbi:MAG: GTPase HflX [Conexivisphaera sp.]